MILNPPKAQGDKQLIRRFFIFDETPLILLTHEHTSYYAFRWLLKIPKHVHVETIL